MKNIIKKIGGLCLGLALLSGIGLTAHSVNSLEVKAESSTFSTKGSFTAPTTVGDITLSWAAGTYSSAPSVGSTYTKVYAGNTVTLTPLNGVTITEIKLTASSNSYIKTWSASDSSNVVVSDKYATWSGNSTSAITLTNTATGQARINTFLVTYTASSMPKLDEPTNLSYSTGLISWGEVDNASGYSLAIDNATPIDIKNATSYNVSSLAQGDHFARVTAKGDGTNYLDSEPSKFISWTTEPYSNIPASSDPFIVDVDAEGETTTSVSGDFYEIYGSETYYPLFVGYHKTTVNLSYHEYVVEKTKGYIQLINLSNATFDTLVVDNYKSNSLTVKMGETTITGVQGTLSNNHLPVTYDLTSGTGSEVTLYATNESYDASIYSLSISFTTPSLTSISLTGSLTKTEYYEGETIDTEGLVVTGTYSDSSTSVITTGIEWMFDPETLSTSDTSCDIVASVDNVMSDILTVTDLTVNSDTIDHIEISGSFNLSYTAGDTLDFDGIEVNKHMTSGNVLPLDDYSLKVGTFDIESDGIAYSRYNNLNLSATYEDFVSSQSTTYTMLVQDKAVMPWSDGGEESFEVIENPASLKNGEKILFTAPNVSYSQTASGTSYTLSGDYAMSVQTDTSKKNIPAVSISGDPLKYEDGELYTLVESDGHWMFKDSNNRYLTATGGTGSNQLQVSNTASVTCKFDIEVDSGNKMKITCSDTATTRNRMLFNCNLNTSTKVFNPMFNCYAFSDTNHSEAKGFYSPIIVRKNAATSPTNKAVYIKDAINTTFLNSITMGSNNTYSVCGLFDSTDARYTAAWSKIESIVSSLSDKDIEDLNVEEIYGNTGYTYAKVLCILLDGAKKSIPSNLAEIAGYPTSSSLLFSSNSSSATWIIVAVSLAGLTAIGGYFFYKKRKENF